MTAQPSYFAEGTTPMKGDGKSPLWQKILGHYQSLAGANPAFNPNRTDPLWMTKYKIRKSLGSATGGGGGGGGGGPVTCSDNDAASFLNTIGNINPAITNAICTLVGSLKSAGVWTLMDVIYPFVGGTSASNSYNLKNPAANQITWHGNMSFSAAGPSPVDATGFGDTGFNPFTATSPNFTLNSAAMGIYIVSGSNTAPMGVTDTSNNTYCVISPNNTLAGVDTCKGPNDATGTQTGSATSRGFYMASRTSANALTLYTPSGNNSAVVASTAVAHGTFYVCAQNFIGGGPLGTGALNFGCVCAGLTPTQESALSSAVTAFNTTLLRN